MKKEYIIIEKTKLHKVFLYNFSNIPQEHLYIITACLFLSSDKKAINRAKKINSNYEYVIKGIK